MIFTLDSRFCFAPSVQRRRSERTAEAKLSIPRACERSHFRCRVGHIASLVRIEFILVSNIIIYTRKIMETIGAIVFVKHSKSA